MVGDGEAPLGRGRGALASRSAWSSSARRRSSIQQGLTESLAGRFELLAVLPHWSFAEMRAAFGFTLDQHLFFGGYPGAAPLIADPARWARYINDSLIETTIARDVLLLTRVDKPALLRRLFELGCRYSGQILSYTKMLGQLQDAGNTTTLAHYLDLLAGAGHADGPAEVRGLGRAPARIEPEAPGAQHGALDGAERAHAGRGPAGRGLLGAADGVRGGRAPRQRSSAAANASSSTGGSGTARWTSSSRWGGGSWPSR